MSTYKQNNPMRAILTIYLLCFVFRGLEYLVLRTDQGIFGEAFLHKLLGICILLAAAKYFSMTLAELGFKKHQAIKQILYGLLLEGAVFTLAYTIEMSLLAAKGDLPSLKLYVSSYAVDGNHGNQTALVFFILCIIGNMINVVMEEGIFRGLFLKLTQGKYAFIRAALISSLLFGVWHIAGPVRSYFDGGISAKGAILSAGILVLSSALVGFKLCLLVKMTGSLWIGMAAHFVNNTIVNLLHVVTVGGADELLMLRITIAQTVLFVLVLLVYLKNHARYKEVSI